MYAVKRMNPHHQRIAEFARVAKDSPKGIVVRFYTQEYADKETAKKSARSFQISFSNMRARERRLAYRAHLAFGGRADEDNFQGPFDHLGCYLREKPDCWEIHISEGSVDPIEVLDGETLKPVKKFTPEGIRWKELSSKLVSALAYAEKSKTKAVNPLTDEEATFMWNYNGEAYREIWEDYGEEPYAPQQEPETGIRAHEGGAVPQD